MGRYFNKTRGNLSITLSPQESVSIPGNSWITISQEFEGRSPSLLRAVRLGHLHRAPDVEQTPATATQSPPTPKAEVVPAPAGTPRTPAAKPTEKKSRRK